MMYNKKTSDSLWGLINKIPDFIPYNMPAVLQSKKSTFYTDLMGNNISCPTYPSHHSG